MPELSWQPLAVILLVVVCGPVSCLLAAVQTLEVKHPVLNHKIDPKSAAAYEKAVRRVMAMSEDEMLSFMPDRPYIRFCECPNCYGGVQGNGIFIWTVERPDELKCRYCGELAYPNPKYAEDEALVGKNRLGEEVRFPYYLNKTKNVPHILSTHLLSHKRFWLLRQCVDLGKAFQTTGKEEYARRVALVLDKCAQVYPHYPALHNRSARRVRFCKSQEPPFAWDAGRWGNFHNEIPKLVIAAYDMTCESKAFDKLSEERGYDVRGKLENDFLRETYRIAAASKYHVGNVVGYDVTGVALLGRVINEASYVHRAFGWMKQNLDEGFFRDGLWHESPSYHYMTIGGLRSAFATVRGYSDPPGYVDTINGTRFDNLDPEQVVPFLAKVTHAPEVLDFPNGCSTPVHDTWPNQRRSRPRDRTVSTIAPAYGHASLGCGFGASQMQAQLHFSGAYGHAHLDCLNLTLFTKGREMLPDLGYTWTQMRYWAACTLSHNTVVIDRQDQVGRGSDGDLVWFFPDSGGIRVVAADGRRAYRNVKNLDTYRRMLVLIPVASSDAYVVDIFRVRGGSTHEWALHGDADRDTGASCNLSLSGKRKWMLEPGEEWTEPTISGSKFNPYGMVRDVQRGETDESFRIDFAYPDDARGLRVHMIPNGRAEVWLGRAPSVRRMGFGTRGDMRKAYDFWMPQLLVRREGDGPLASLFAAIEEPHSGEPFITSIEQLPLTPPDPNAIAIRVTHGDTVDTIISTLDQPPYPERRTPDGITLRGRLGIVRQPNQASASGLWLFEGSKLAAASSEMAASASYYAGPIDSATRKSDGADHDALVTSTRLPLGDTLHGAWMMLKYPNGFVQGHEIDRVETLDGKTLIILTADHGLRIKDSETREVLFPQRKMKGANTFTIPLAATVRR